jgi:hypothetical protein
MKNVYSYDLETEDGGIHINDAEIRWGPHLRRIIQCAVVGEEDECWYWCVPPKTEHDTKTIPGGYERSEERMLFHFLTWIMEKKQKTEGHLYMVAHNGLGFDLPFLEERILQVLGGLDREGRHRWYSILQHPSWLGVKWIDSLTTAYKKWSPEDMTLENPDYKLNTCFRRLFGEDIKEAHQAYPDALALHRMVNSLEDVMVKEGRCAIWVENPSIVSFPLASFSTDNKKGGWRNRKYFPTLQEAKERYVRCMRIYLEGEEEADSTLGGEEPPRKRKRT